MVEIIKEKILTQQHKKPKVGDELFLVKSKYSGKGNIYEGPCKVAKVGRKYFYVLPNGYAREICFRLDNWHGNTEYSSTYNLYPSKQCFLDESEKNKLRRDIERFLSDYRWRKKDLSLDQLRRIKAIIDEGGKQENIDK